MVAESVCSGSGTIARCAHILDELHGRRDPIHCKFVPPPCAPPLRRERGYRESHLILFHDRDVVIALTPSRHHG